MCRWAQLCARANPKIWTPPTCSPSLPLPPPPSLPLPPPPSLPPPLTDRRPGSSSARRRRRVRTCWQPPPQQNAFRRVQNLAAAAVVAEEEEAGPSGSCCRVKCWAGKCDVSIFFCIFFGGLERVGHSFAYVAHFLFLRDVWIRNQRAAVASRRATNWATYLPSIYLLINFVNYELSRSFDTESTVRYVSYFLSDTVPGAVLELIYGNLASLYLVRYKFI